MASQHKLWSHCVALSRPCKSFCLSLWYFGATVHRWEERLKQVGGANEASQGVFWWKLGLTFTSTEAQTLEKFKHVFPVGVQILCAHAFSSGGTLHKTYIIDYKSKWFKILILTTPHYQTTNCGVTLILWLQFMTVIEILSCLGAEWGDISPNGKSLRTDVSEPRLFLITSLSFCQSADYLNESEPNTWITCAATTE